MEFRNIYADNAFIFMSDFEQAVKEGYRVQNTIIGYPRLQGMLKECKMFRSPEIVDPVPSDETDSEVTVTEYCPVKFLEKCQALVLAGYEVFLKAPVYGISMGSPHRCMFLRTEEADAVIAEDVVEKEVKRRGRKPRKS